MIGKYNKCKTDGGWKSEQNKQTTKNSNTQRVNDHLMICRGVNKQNLFYIFKCPHRGTAKYTSK